MHRPITARGPPEQLRLIGCLRFVRPGRFPHAPPASSFPDISNNQAEQLWHNANLLKGHNKKENLL